MEIVSEVLYEQVAAEANGADVMNGELNEEGDENNEDDTNVLVPSSPSASIPTTPVTPTNINLRVSVYVQTNRFLSSIFQELKNL